MLESNISVEQLLKAEEKYGSPLYVYDVSSVINRINKMKNILEQKYEICYAMKSNSFIAKAISNAVARLEVCSPGEYEICARNGIDLDKIIISGITKTYGSMSRILELSEGKGIYTIESELHVDILLTLAKQIGKKLKVQIRLSCGDQFGVDKEGFYRIAKKVVQSDYLELMGIHFYSGTMKKIQRIEKEIRMLDEFAKNVKNIIGIDFLELEYGPGLITNCFVNNEEIADEQQLIAVRDVLDTIEHFDEVTVELGRYLSAYCGYYITRVVDKKTNDNLQYCIVDGGIHQINYYENMFGMNIPYVSAYNRDHMGRYKKEEPDYEKKDRKYIWNVCGSLCTKNDVIVRDVELGSIDIDSLLIFERCGAYSSTECMALFLSRDLPKVVLYEEQIGFKLVRDRTETYFLNAE